jgi:hypothetical protein
MAYHCVECGAGAAWRVTRRGDGAVSWACPQHLPAVCDGMQRDDEINELVVILVAKLLAVLFRRQLMCCVVQGRVPGHLGGRRVLLKEPP